MMRMLNLPWHSSSKPATLAPPPAQLPRALKGQYLDIWRYRIHYSPHDLKNRYGISHNQQVVHRCKSMQGAVRWVTDQAQEFVTRHANEPRAAKLLESAMQLLRQQGRLQ